MPLNVASNLSSLSVGAGYYDLQYDSCVFNYNNISISSNVLSGVLDVHYYITKSNNYLPAYSFKFTGSNLGEVDSLVRVYSSVYDPRIYVGSESFDLAPDLFSPFKVYANYHIEATAQNGNTHFGCYSDNTSDVTNFFIQNSNNSGNFDIDASIFIESPITWYSGNSSFVPERIYNSRVTELELIIVCPYGAFKSHADSHLLSKNPNGAELNILCWFGSNSNNFAFVNFDTSSSSNGMLNAGLSSIQNSVNQVSTNVTNQVNQVKTQISQSTNTITTKIDTMSNDVKTGLQNVVTSAQQNTQNIINTVTNKVEEVKTGITEVKDSIIDLPNKLEEMFTGFFVPDEEIINSKYSEFETLLSDRFGLIYQSADIIHDFADSFQTQAVMTADTGGVITMPQVTVSLAGTPFTFGGYEVDIIPDGFETLQQMCRLAVSMVCTVVFINMLKSKLEWILR